MATRGSVTPASAAGRAPADLSVHVDTWSEYIAGSAASPAARYPAPQSPARVKHVGEGEVLFKLKTIHAAAHQAVAAARRRPEIRVGAVRKSDPAEPVFDSSPALFQPSASVLSVPGTPSGNPGATGAFVRPPTGVSTTRSEHHVRSYHQSEALATRQELGPNMLPLPPEGQLFINTSTWGNYFHEKERDQAISSYLGHAKALAIQAKDYRVYSNLKDADEGKAPWQRITSSRGTSAGSRRKSAASVRRRSRAASAPGGARIGGSRRTARPRSAATTAVGTAGRSQRPRRATHGPTGGRTGGGGPPRQGAAGAAARPKSAAAASLRARRTASHRRSQTTGVAWQRGGRRAGDVATGGGGHGDGAGRGEAMVDVPIPQLPTALFGGGWDSDGTSQTASMDLGVPQDSSRTAKGPLATPKPRPNAELGGVTPSPSDSTNEAGTAVPTAHTYAGVPEPEPVGSPKHPPTHQQRVEKRLHELERFLAITRLPDAHDIIVAEKAARERAEKAAADKARLAKLEQQRAERRARRRAAKQARAQRRATTTDIPQQGGSSGRPPRIGIMRRAKTPVAGRGGMSPASQAGDDTPRSGSTSPPPRTSRSVRSVRSVQSVRSARSMRHAPSSPMLRARSKRGTGPELKKGSRQRPPPLMRSQSAASGLGAMSRKRMPSTKRLRSRSPLVGKAATAKAQEDSHTGANTGASADANASASADAKPTQAAGPISGSVPDTPVSPDGKQRAMQRKREHRGAPAPPVVDTSSPPLRRASEVFSTPRNVDSSAVSGGTTDTAASSKSKAGGSSGPSWRLKASRSDPKPGTPAHTKKQLQNFRDAAHDIAESLKHHPGNRLHEAQSFFNVYRSVVRTNQVLEYDGAAPVQGVPLSILHRMNHNRAPHMPLVPEEAVAKAKAQAPESPSPTPTPTPTPSEAQTASPSPSVAPTPTMSPMPSPRRARSPLVPKSAPADPPRLMREHQVASGAGSGAGAGNDDADNARQIDMEALDSELGLAPAGKSQAGDAGAADGPEPMSPDLLVPVRQATPRTVALMAAQERHMLPEMTGLTRIKNGVVGLSGAGVGDDRAQVLAAGVAVSKDVRHMSLRRNRLTHKGLVPILDSLPGRNLLTLDLGHNKLGHKGAVVLAQVIVRELHALETLGLESTGLVDGDLTVIADALQASVTIHTLILRGNSFGEPGMEALGSLLAWQSSTKRELVTHTLPRYMEGQGWSSFMLAKQKKNNKSAMPRPSTYRLLRETGTVEEKRVWVLDLMAKRKREGRQWGVRHLDLAWTGLREYGAATFFELIKGNERLQTLDLGFNRLGGGGLAHEALGALADFLKVNTSLHHLNLSNNNIKREHALILAQGMQDNRTLLGLHMTGNEVLVNPRGFIVPAPHRDPRAVILPPVEHYVTTLRLVEDEATRERKRKEKAAAKAALAAERAAAARAARAASVRTDEEDDFLLPSDGASTVMGVGSDGGSTAGGDERKSSSDHNAAEFDAQSPMAASTPAKSPKHADDAGTAATPASAKTFDPLDEDSLKQHGLTLVDVVPAPNTALYHPLRQQLEAPRVKPGYGPLGYMAGAGMSGGHWGREDVDDGGKYDDTMEATRGTKEFETVTAILVAEAQQQGENAGAVYNTLAVDTTNGHTQHRIVSAGLAEEEAYRPREADFSHDPCWVCGKWRPFVFEWIPAVSGPAAHTVEVMLDFEGWEPDPMRASHDGVFTIARMVPSSRFFFMFRVDGVLRVSQSEMYVHRDRVGVVASSDEARSSTLWSDALRSLVVPTRGPDGFLLPGAVYVNYLADDNSDGMLRAIARAQAQAEKARREEAAAGLRLMGFTSRSVMAGDKDKAGGPTPTAGAVGSTPKSTPDGIRIEINVPSGVIAGLGGGFDGKGGVTPVAGRGVSGRTSTRRRRARSPPRRPSDDSTAASPPGRGQVTTPPATAASETGQARRRSTVQQESRRGSMAQQESRRGSMAQQESRRGSMVQQESRRGSVTQAGRRRSVAQQESRRGSMAQQESRRGSVTQGGRRRSVAQQESRRGSLAQGGARRGSVARRASTTGKPPLGGGREGRARRGSTSSVASQRSRAGGATPKAEPDHRLALMGKPETNLMTAAMVKKFANKVGRRRRGSAGTVDTIGTLAATATTPTGSDMSELTSDTDTDSDSSSDSDSDSESERETSKAIVGPGAVLTSGFDAANMFRIARAGTAADPTTGSGRPRWSSHVPKFKLRGAMLRGAGGSRRRMKAKEPPPPQVDLRVVAALAKVAHTSRRRRRRPDTASLIRNGLEGQVVGKAVSKLRGVQLMKSAVRRVGLLSLAIKRRPPPEILPRTVNPLFKTERRGAWTLKKSMFEGYRQETPNLLTKAFESDWTKCAVRRVVKDKVQFQLAKATMRKHFPLLKDIFKYYAARGHTDAHLFTIHWGAFTELAVRCRLRDKNLPMSTLDSIFINTNAANTGQPMNPDRALTRYEFLEAVVRIAKVKFNVTTASPPKLHEMSIGEAIDIVVMDHLTRARHMTSHKWRYERMYFEEVNIVLKQAERQLREVYEVYSGRDSLPGEAAWMGVQEWLDLLDDAHLMARPADYKVAVLAFVYAQFLEVDEGEEKNHMRLTFPEFIEALCRLADSLFAPGEKIESGQPAPLCVRLPRFITAVGSTLTA